MPRPSGRPGSPLRPLEPKYALAWSYTRHRMLRECERAVFWQYFGSRGLGLRDGDPAGARAFALRHLTTLPLLVGTAVHAAARRVVEAVVERRAVPPIEELLAGARFTLNQAWRNSQPDLIDRFWRYPAAHNALLEIVYRGALRPAEITRASGRLRDCLDALTDAPVLDDLRACGAADVWLAPDAFPVSFDPAPGQLAWGAVDFAYRHSPDAGGTSAPGAPAAPTWCVADWKTGSSGSPDDESLQLATYGLWLRARGFPDTDGVYLGRIIDLARREDRFYVLDRALLDRARAAIAEDLARLRGLMRDRERVLPRSKAEWHLAADVRGCPRCRFYGLCLTDLASRRGPGAPEGRGLRGAPGVTVYDTPGAGGGDTDDGDDADDAPR